VSTNRARWPTLVVATVTVSAGPQASTACAARIASASRDRGPAVGSPIRRASDQYSAASRITAVVMGS
jgi:hypothetical protein